MLASPLNKSPKPLFLQSTIIGHFQQAREINREADELEDKIIDLEDRCEVYRETVHKEQIRYDKTMSKYSLTPKAFYKSSINLPQIDDDDPTLLPLKREIKDLKFKLRMVQKESSKYQAMSDSKLTKNQVREINFARTLSPAIASNLKTNYCTEKEYNNLVIDLKNQTAALDKRKILAERILANPIDNLYAYEVLTEKAEKSQLILQQRYETASPIRIDIVDFEKSVERLENDNKSRYQNLLKRKQMIELSKKTQRSRIATSPYTPKTKKKKTIPQLLSKKPISVSDKIREMDNIFQKIQVRAGELVNKEAEGDRLTQEMVRKRDDLESFWEAKMTTINQLSNKYREIQNIQMKIHAVAEQNTRIKLCIIDINDEKSRLGREQSSFMSNKSNLLQMQSYIKQNHNSILDSQSQIDAKERELFERKRRLERSKEEILKKKTQLQIFNNQVELIESKVAQMKAQINAKHHQVKQELTELSISFAENASKISGTRSFEEEFLNFDPSA